jgi:hypothetical protein
MSVCSERDLMHNGGNGGLGARVCATSWGSRALALTAGVVGVFFLAMVATGGDTGGSSGSNSKTSKPSFTDMSAGPISMNDKGAIDTSDVAILPAGQMLNDDRPYITLFGTPAIESVVSVSCYG